MAYDAVGNITYTEGPGGTGTPAYSANRLQSWPGYTFTTDADGNLATRTTQPGGVVTTYHWSPDGLLDSVTTGSQRVRYDYNAFGLLVRRWTSAAVPDRHFLWGQGHLLLELDGGLKQRVGEYAYLPGTDKPVALLTGPPAVNEVRVIYQDVTGNVHALWKTTGAADRYQTTSDPWGVTGYGATDWTVALPDTMRLRFQGLVYEGGLANLYYARARWYDPTTRRFLSPDPLGIAAGPNPYVFAGNDPVNLSDPTGLQSYCRETYSWYWDYERGAAHHVIEVVCDDRNRGVNANPSARAYANNVSYYGLKHAPQLKVGRQVLGSNRVFGVLGRLNLVLAGAIAIYDIASIASCAAEN